MHSVPSIDSPSSTGSSRVARPRRYLMCPPRYFDVSYSINPWMDPSVPTSVRRALRQWRRLQDVLRDLGHDVAMVDPLPGLPDMVFTANAAVVLGETVVVARFRYRERQAESAAYAAWFRAHKFTGARQATHVNEGEGDYLRAGDRILAGSGFRSSARAHREVEQRLGVPIVPLTLVDPRYYHLDTALAVLGEDEIAYYPPAFAEASRALLRELYSDAVVADEETAASFGLNAVSDGRHVVLPAPARRLAGALAERGFYPISVDFSELLKSGGGPKCCVLELHPDRPDAGEGSVPAGAVATPVAS